MSDNTTQNAQSVQLSRTTLIVVIVAVVFGIAGITLAIVALTASQVGIALFATETPTPTVTPVPTATLIPPTVTPNVEDAYAQSMVQTLADIELFRIAVSRLNEAFDSPILRASDYGTAASIVDLNSDSVISVTEYLVSQDNLAAYGMADPSNMRILERPLGGRAGMVDRRGFAVLSQLQAVEPPAEIATYHGEIVCCVEAELRRAELIRSMIQGRQVSADWETAACNRLDRSVNEIEKYIDAVSSAE